MHQWQQDKIPIYQLGDEFYDVVVANSFKTKQLCYLNNSIDIEKKPDFLTQLSPLPNNISSPLALRYHGHQFQHYNPHLGDGRGFLYAQFKLNNQWYDLGTKGSGKTPYSRGGDGRLTLKGAFRETLATEMLESLGVKTSKTLCFFETHESLIRNDEPSPTRSAVLIRFSLGHIRIGTFQRLAYLNQRENIKKLISYCMHFYYAEHLNEKNLTDEKQMASDFLYCVTESNTQLVSQIMLAGFIHGVLNTDNINISGELFDYGPYRFMPKYNPSFTAAYFDNEGLYCYQNQPAAFLWSLERLSECIQLAYPHINIDHLAKSFSNSLNKNVRTLFLKKLNITTHDTNLIDNFFNLFFEHLHKNDLHFEQVFFDFNSKKILTLPKKEIYEKTAENLLHLLEKFEVADFQIANNPYFQLEKPCTLLIDELESIWSNISEHNDWSPFHNKLQLIRNFRGLY